LDGRRDRHVDESVSCWARRCDGSCYGYFDAHHDSGYRQSFADYQACGRFSCEDWTYPHHQAGARIAVRYPGWRARWAEQESDPRIPVDRCTDDGQPVHGAFTDVFACRSGGWVPAWCDDQWQQFIDAFPGQVRRVDPDLRARWHHPASGTTTRKRATAGDGPR
jgi:hypothetical protein